MEKYMTEIAKDYIICEICGKQFRQITNTHLAKHNLTYQEYINMFPKAKTISDSCKNQYIKYNQNIALAINHDKFAGKIQNIDYVECPLCNKRMKNLTNHIIRSHGINVETFKKQYPETQIKSRRTYALISESISKTRKKIFSNPELSVKFRENARKGAINSWNKLDASEKGAKMRLMRQVWNEKYKNMSDEEKIDLLHSKYSHKKIQFLSYVFRSNFEYIVGKYLYEKSINYEHERLLIHLPNGHDHLTDFYIKQYNLILECKSLFHPRKSEIEVLNDVYYKKNSAETLGYHYEIIWFSKPNIIIEQINNILKEFSI